MEKDWEKEMDYKMLKQNKVQTAINDEMKRRNIK